MRLGARGPLVAAYPFVSTLADIGVAATFANLLLSSRFAAEDGFFTDLSPIHRRLSDFSYSLYATTRGSAFLFGPASEACLAAIGTRRARRLRTGPWLSR